MLSQKLYFEIRDAVNRSDFTHTAELQSFIRPYVLIIHDDGRGFYLDRQYRHILDIKDCQIPDMFTEVMAHQCATSNVPAWAAQELPACFTTFWLY